MSVTLRWVAWTAFDPDSLYALMRLRSAVFVVEQACIFHEMDGLDPRCEHLLATDAQGDVVGCLRLVPPRLQRPHSTAPAADGPALGRLVTALSERGTGLGRRLMAEGIARCERDFPGAAIQLSAQQPLESFYSSMGFEAMREPYDEDGILHVDMRRQGAMD
ncbi:ElaA protein [Panacagrimonas perspica]|uniref:ElaA protein n=1 Tax=Panacagrimonas perspica TaxID=381431 RepID=A0A4S3K4R3_9GAMM|nr:GNAT family N-acetyltransferase [Panacagrimonas perspica]TDU25872.1 ElaA protein [Panacagrimonas perspica]THD02764.1 GNAT family N-acetyltransferase [Panacagrimonas perspica]